MAISHAILLVEPQGALAGRIAHALSAREFAVHLVRDGTSALELASGQPLEVLLTEDSLPDQTGLELVQTLTQRLPHLRCILFEECEPQVAKPHLPRLVCLPKPFEMSELLATVDQSLIELEAERLQEEAMSAMAHDLKIPLTSIMGCCSLLLGPEQFDELRKREMVSCIHRNSQRVLAMLDNHLTICRARSGQLSLDKEPVDLRKMIEDLVYVMQFEAERHRCRLEAHYQDGMPEQIRCDEQLMHRALGNLMMNAIKYSPWEATISITVEPAVLEDGRAAAAFTISNPGRGIPPDELDRIFEPYRRAGNMKGIEGVGLGLSVVKMVAEAHEGAVTAASEVNVQTSFRMIIPAD